jgi:transcriptional regulator with XRE-family HTH domain
MESGLLTLQSSSEIATLIGQRIKSRRKFLNQSRKVLSQRSGVSVPTLVRLENKGIATINIIIKVAIALDSIDSFAELFKNPPAKSLEEYERILRIGS